MVKSITDSTTLHNGVKMPWFGLGVWKAEDGDEVKNAVTTALKTGYRSIDTAAVYGNETGVGQGIKESGVPRDEIFVTTKVWNNDQGYESTFQAYEESLKRLDLEYVDLYLIHWPVTGKFKDTWRALEKLYKDGRVRAIGVCNFHIHHLESLFEDCEIKPMVNQVECHPKLTQKPLISFCEAHNIQFEAWSPLMQGKILDHPLLVEIGNKYGKTAAQVVIRWDIDSKLVTIPKSVTESRIIANADVFDFELTKEEVDKINALNEDHRVGRNPDEF